MSWEFDNSVPIYLQIIDRIKLQIASGKLNSGDKLGSVRDLAQETGVNPNTMQRALAELEREQLIYSVRTSGRYITENTELINQLRASIAKEKINALFDTLYELGYKDEEIGMIISKKVNLRGE